MDSAPSHPFSPHAASDDPAKRPPILRAACDRRPLHVLHIGKTGGTALQHALRPFSVTRSWIIHLHRHARRLRDIPVGAGVVFFLRDPASRFVSGFHSRQRMGHPSRHVPWTADEHEAFSRYPTPNALALALAAEGDAERLSAEQAMRSIAHVRTSFWDWIGDESALRARLGDIVFVGFQESLAQDFASLRSILGIPSEAALPDDDALAHRAPPQLDRSLAPEAVAALRRWYADDERFIRLCVRLLPRDRLGAASARW